ncbi:PREDICTED: neurofilament medium polypeptide-like [Nicotiana attenuata]|uniref:neurofilament medium polypeptide-like n=1 Tax=Nicotiana attenuata TaxID=49451 RepID=UPI000905CE41|nr:PREDICTED: neurofilament medium polypeptide-like [Nicotiana attenuata]
MAIGESEEESEVQRQEPEDEAIGLVRSLNEITAQADAAPEEGTGDGTDSSIQGNLTGGIEQRGTESNISMESVHEPVPQQQNIGETSRGNQLVVEESSKKTGGSGSEEAAEGLVNLGKHTDEPGSFVEETLADLLKRVGDSYKPKKNRTPKLKTPVTARANKKRKDASSETTETPLPKGRATRSKLKKSEEELQKAMEESKKKRMDKGKAKVAEPIEAVDVDKMDPVHQGEHVTVEVEFAEPSTLAKRTRSAVKSKQVKITEEEDWSGEEEDESDNEQDKLAKFGKRTILKGRLLKDLEEKGMVLLLERLELGEILGIPSEGYDDYTRQKWPSLDSLPTALSITRKFCDNKEVNAPKAVYKSEMKPSHKVLFEFVIKCVLPRQERRQIANYMDLVLMECLDSGR